MKNLRLVLGGPGCGKTTRLLEIVEEEMHAGVPPTAIAFVSFTKEAASTARLRAATKFNLDPEKDLPWFRTIHSLTYAQLGINRDEMMERRDWQEFSTVVGERISGVYDNTEGVASGRETGDMLLRICDYASTTMRPLEEAWHDLREAVNWHRLVRFHAALAAYKDDTGKMDFTDLLHYYLREGKPVPVQVAVIDEAQDLTAAQWAVVRRAFGDAERVYVGGDDDQAIYHWAGADVDQFLSLHALPEILPLSHRLPRQIHAFSQTIARRISTRYVKQFSSSERDGDVLHHQHAEGIDLSAGTWFLLARNTYLLGRLEDYVRQQGYNYMRRSGPAVHPGEVRAMMLWERVRSGKQKDMSAQEFRALAKLLDLPKPQTRETHRYTLTDLQVAPERFALPWFEVCEGISLDRRDYYLAALRRGEKLSAAPRIRIETIHGVKGGEAENVVLLSDVSDRTMSSFRVSPDNEHRVFYVGATRALKTLHIVRPQSDRFYPLS